MPRKTPNRSGKSKRRGGRRPVSFVTHPDTDRPILGLRFHKSSNRYYRIDGEKKRVYYARKKLRGIEYQRRAIYEHECWQQGNEPNETVSRQARHPAFDDFGTEISPVATFDDQGRETNVRHISQEDVVAYFREQLGDPAKRARFADAVGYPELLNLHALRSPTEPLLLESVIQNYVVNKSLKHARQYADLKRSWQIFADTVGVRTLEEIDVPNVQAFAQAVAASGKARTQKNNVLHVQTILKYAADVYKDHRERINDLKADIRRLCSPPKIKTKRQPKPMKSPDFLALLDHCTKNEEKKWTALLLVALNFAMHGAEVTEVESSDFDFGEGSFGNKRTKTGVPRVGMIWKRTTKAIQAYRQSDEYQHHESLLFTDAKGKPITIYAINRKIRQIRKDENLGNSVVFDGIRDLTRTKAGAESRIAIAWLMGHTLGEDDQYAHRDPHETAKVLAKVERAVFGGKGRKK